jgi:hypothetical protein
MNEIENVWAPTANRFVGYIDIMGFKNMVETISHDEVHQMMITLNDKRKLVESIDWKGLNINLIKTTTYSDSLIIYSKDESYESFRYMVSTLAGLTDELLLEKIPHKGALAFGLMTLDEINSIFFGKPLIDAFLLQEQIYFYGILMHGSAEKEYLKYKATPWVHDYPCKLKNGVAKHLTIYPMSAVQSKQVEDVKDFANLIKSINDFRLQTSGHLRAYIDNTLDFVTEIHKL